MARLQYTLRFPRPTNHLVEVDLRVTGVRTASIDLSMPAWVPGSYKIRDFARHVQEFRCSRPFRKTDKQTWRVSTDGRRSVVVRYRVYAFELTVRSSHLDSDHAYLNPGTICMAVAGRTNEPYEVRIRARKGWKVATGLTRRGAGWVARDFDELVDCPIEVSKFARRKFRARGRPHEFVVCGNGNHSVARLASDAKKIVEAAARIFGHLPYERYLFLLHASERGSGGLEHRNSTSLQVGRFFFSPRSNYQRILRLIAHEYFHTWNVKSILPEAFRPFDYSKEMYSELLWLMEGVTNYYALLIPARAGLTEAEEVRGVLTQWFNGYESKPGRFVQSAAESSFDTWIKLYQPNEQTVNSTISYYEKGQLIGLVLDMEIRRRSRGRRSLDEVMRRLYQDFARQGRGVGPGDVVRVAEEAGGGSLKRFFADYVDGIRPLPLGSALRTVGLKLESGRKNRSGYLGVAVDRGAERIEVRRVLAGSPAERSGLSVGDVIVAVNGYRASEERWDHIIEGAKPGGSMRLHLFREGRLLEQSVRLGAIPQAPKTVRVDRSAPKGARAEHRRWIGYPWK